MARILIGLEDKMLAASIEEYFSKHSYPAGTEVKLLHAIEAEEAVYAWPSDQYRKDAEELVSGMTKRLKQRFPEFDVAGEIVEGYAKEKIVESAKAWSADLIVVGSHGKQGLNKFILGSVSMEVLSHAPCSIVVLRYPVSNTSGKAERQDKATAPTN
ncbi:MAG: universal stress protein [Candidatus Obscuribacterales bacterium]|nr:universal stress protein [Candidatus Obscuribacterales bacterium]